MLKPFRVGAIVVALLTVGGGVAMADPVNVPNVTHSVETADGYHLSASLSGLPSAPTAIINPASNMAATAFSREGFISASATETIDGKGSVPVKKGTLTLGALCVQ
jgi:hypothetical protein